MNNQTNVNNDYNVVVKVGSNVLYGEKDGIDGETMQNIVNGVTFLKQEARRNVFLVSSGAVAVGKKELEESGEIFSSPLSPKEQSRCASFGQPILFQKYAHMFEDKKIKVAQILLNHRDLENSENRAKTLELLQSFGPNQIPIINANDSNSHEELHGTKFSDNDELASLVAQGVKAKILLILSNVKGFYKHYGKENQALLDRISFHEMDEAVKHVSTDISGNGTGGMGTKFLALKKIMQQGGNGMIADGKEKDIIQKIFQGGGQKTVFHGKEL